MASSTGPLPQTAPDAYGKRPGEAGYLACYGATLVSMSVANAGIVWQLGVGNPPTFDQSPEVNQPPAYRSMRRRADAIRWRAAVPAAQLQPGALQATVTIDTSP
jgi:hypothetical protein